MKERDLLYFLLGVSITSLILGMFFLFSGISTEIFTSITLPVSDRALELEGGELFVKNGHAEGVYISGGVILCSFNEGACLHEVGHRLDEGGGKISETKEFREALDNFIIRCIINEDEWGIEDFYCNLVRFPGLNGNSIDDWGGYKEAYAEMYKYNKQLGYVIPAELVEFFIFEIK